MPRIPVTYTFGNHMHWVDMEWLWGAHVLPGSVEDMLEFCRQTGARGNVNFDAVGYERLAAQHPDAFFLLREAVRDGHIEVVGASYGQPYGLFHGGESNIRQRVMGVHAVERLFGKRPITFWEEEFDFFPQLPQILARCGFEYGSLFFQWTWHTPHIPHEEEPAVWWVSPDGSRLFCATRNRLNLHQWPEDFDGLLDSLAERHREHPEEVFVQQWLELMPSPDWMCRSEVLLPRMREWLADERFEVRFATLAEALAAIRRPDSPQRSYPMDQVWHGMSLGKNGDRLRLRSARAEGTLLTAEAISSGVSLLGRPYAQWDVYPTWEIEEGWQELLIAQHHDNDECEGLCGHIGLLFYDRADSIAADVVRRSLVRAANELATGEGEIVFNPLGWPRSDTVNDEQGIFIVRDLPAFGFRFIPAAVREAKARPWRLSGNQANAAPEPLEVIVDARKGLVTLLSPDWPEGALSAPLFDLSHREGGELRRWRFEIDRIDEESGDLVLRSVEPSEHAMEVWLKLPSDLACLDVTFRVNRLGNIDPGLNAGLRWRIPTSAEVLLTADTPYQVSPVAPEHDFLRKYPTGDWMTSPQWFETVSRPFTALSMVDLGTEERGLLILQDRARQWFAVEGGIECVLTMHDPWDEDKVAHEGHGAFRLIPRGSTTNADRWRRAREFQVPVVSLHVNGGAAAPADMPSWRLEPTCGVALAALYREANGCGIDYPFVARLVELDGSEHVVRIVTPGEVARAYRTNLLGDVEEELTVSGTTIEVRVRPYEICTVIFDLVPGRKQVRDLDAKREVWATVHRVESQ